MATLKQLEKEVKKLKNRNKKVEIDKAWEGSYVRRILLMLFTYFAVALYFQAININQPWLNAIVPAIAFMLSTLTLPYFKKQWMRHFYKK